MRARTHAHVRACVRLRSRARARQTVSPQAGAAQALTQTPLARASPSVSPRRAGQVPEHFDALTRDHVAAVLRRTLLPALRRLSISVGRAAPAAPDAAPDAPAGGEAA